MRVRVCDGELVRVCVEGCMGWHCEDENCYNTIEIASKFYVYSCKLL